MIYKIVQGNGFKIHILVRKMDVSREFQRLVDFDMSKAESVTVELQSGIDDSISLRHTMSGISNNVLICDVPSDLGLGNYSIKVSWTLGNEHMSSVERGFLQVVPFNSKSKIPIDIVEGERIGMFNLRYYLVTDNVSMCPFTYALDDVTLTNSPVSVKNGESFETEIKPSVGFNIGLVKVIMNGVDITDVSYQSGKIVIPAVSGYVTIMANGDDNVYYCGASSAKDICEMNMEVLTKFDGDLVGKSITIVTTESEPYVWFVSKVPVVFMQAGFDAAMHKSKVGDLYFYWSDELSAGDNVYNIKLK